MNTSAKSSVRLEDIVLKSTIKQTVYKNTLASVLEKGAFDAEFLLAADMLLFSMHSNVFVFNREHPVWKVEYIKKDPLNSYCGIINIYNFLSDSFKYNRMQDLGYLIARIFINRENHFFVEGKRQSGELVKDFEKDVISKDVVKQILDTSIRYAIEFDLLVPPYDQVKIASVEQMKEEINQSKIQTGKRLGFKFNSDDV